MKKKLRAWIAGGTVLTVLAGAAAIPTLAASERKSAYLDYHNISVVLDGKTLDLRDANGSRAEPFTINGTTYLPVAAIGRALGLEVSWDSGTNTVVLTSQGGQTASSASYIGEARAREIALSHAGVKESQATFLRSELDWDDGRAEYEVEFWSGNTEYDYEIDARTGAILSYDADIGGYTIPTGSVSSASYIGEARAREIALSHAGVKESQATFLRSELDWDDGRAEYEVEFWSGNTEYDYEIDACTGAILSYDADIEGYTIPTGNASSASYIGETKARSIVEARAGTTGVYREFKLERDDGRMVYEGELYSGGWEYEFQIDALTGTVLEWEVDRD